ncbi:AAA family ATPase [Alkaliphilus sp. B6464]|uniref:AAA family ATPase n=1 Tax=Alkaliphilus sp. B6464 TaxID=2731219 RepID=UPI001BAADD50|nr:AAA family ATPase [Alkaliphilus sp. B6464]QUH21931.1 AAA family ATPase [Alkaliphilus sp. B6464]
MKLIGQDKIIDSLDFKGPYAIIGPKGSGKTTLAKEIALKVVCEHGLGCRDCKKCSTFISENYPDFHYLSGGKIDEVKELVRKLNIKPFYKRHVVIFDNFDEMTFAAQNSLLTIIEESTQDILFILVGSKVSKILRTILSRCYKLSPTLLGEDVIKKQLKEKYPEEDIKLLDFAVSYSFGSLGVAFDIIERKEFYIMLREDVLNIKKKNFFEMASRYAKDYKGDTNEIFNFYEKFIRYLMIKNIENNVSNIRLYNSLKQLLEYKEQMDNNINKTMLFQNIIISLQKAI